MARRRPSEPSSPAVGVRAELIVRYRSMGVRFAGIGATSPPGGPVPASFSRFTALADALEAGGGPVVLWWWQLPRWMPDRPRSGRVVLGRDGQVIRSLG